MMQNAIFIDTSNLNVMFKVNGKFVLAANYANCPVKIATDAQSLGSSFDVYFSVWPRQRGEGDGIIHALSFGGVPFVVLKREMEAISRLMKNVPGIDNIYICNALANFAIPSRVENFQSVINYGQRIALVTVKQRMLEGLRIFNNADELYKEMGGGFSCYGDMDLIDTDAIKAQYEELTSFNKGVIVPLAHLISSYRSSNNITLSDMERELCIGEFAGRTPDPEPEPAPEPVVEKPKKAPRPVVIEEPDDGPVKESVEFKKAGVSIINVILTMVILASCAIIGFGYSFQKIAPQIEQMNAEISAFNTDAAYYDSLAEVYLSCTDMASYVADLLSYAKVNPCSFTIAGLDADSASVVIRVNSISAEAIESFSAYMSERYIVGGVTQLDTTRGANDLIIYNYIVTIIRQ